MENNSNNDSAPPHYEAPRGAKSGSSDPSDVAPRKMDRGVMDRGVMDRGVMDRGDRGLGEEFVHLLLEHEPQVRSFLRRLLPTCNDVDEVLQETSMIAWRKFSEFERGTAFGGWFLTIARFEALKHRRRLAKSPLVFADDVWELLADEGVERTDKPFQQHLDTCLGKLHSEQRKLILRIHTPGVVIRELAEQSGKSEQAFYKVVQRLREKLLDCVTKSIAREGT